MTKNKSVVVIGGMVVFILVFLYLTVIYPQFVANLISVDTARSALLEAIQDGQEFEIVWEHQPDRFHTCFVLNRPVVANIVGGREIETSNFLVDVDPSSGNLVMEMKIELCQPPETGIDNNDG